VLKIIFLSFCLIGKVVSKDTLMESFHKDRVYYNLIMDDGGKVLVSSNEGVFEINGSKFTKLSNNKGYIQLKKGHLSFSKFTDEPMHTRFNHLLPNYHKRFQHYSLKKDPFIYVVSNNSLFIFKLSNYKTYLSQTSVRSFTTNSIGTYDGIYCYGEKIKIPKYTSGYILEQDSIFYICYDGLAIYKPNDSLQLFKRDLSGETKINQHTIGYSRDIYRLADGRFVLATTKGIYLLSSNMTSVDKILEEESKMAPLLLTSMNYQNPSSSLFPSTIGYFNIV
jgi:hypothetical protein